MSTDVRPHWDRLTTIGSQVATVCYRALVYSIIAFLLAPLLIVVVISFQETPYGGWPPEQYSLEWYTEIPEAVGYLGLGDALTTSLQVAIATAIIATAIGGLAAFGLVRSDLESSATLETLFLSPLIYPWMLVGFAILLVIGRIRTDLGVQIPLSFWTLLLGHVIITLPFTIRTTTASLQNFDHTLEEAAQDLGATEVETFRYITLPLVKPGLVSGAMFAFVLSFNQYIVSLFLAGPQSQTLPLRLFNLFFNTPPQQIAAIGTLLMVGTLVLVAIAEYTVGISEYM
ncbi:ABC transporter permease [Natrialbaceae archaeon A-chndr2]|uniref:ABC transporter permease n=1 Tax=Natronosalvus amylolyticus TaxID=2961994 RepID=UPI0020C99F2D|nr:ABC transporter permease [Natronosalvus amylolyticus]